MKSRFSQAHDAPATGREAYVRKDFTFYGVPRIMSHAHPHAWNAMVSHATSVYQCDTDSVYVGVRRRSRSRKKQRLPIRTMEAVCSRGPACGMSLAG